MRESVRCGCEDIVRSEKNYATEVEFRKQYVCTRIDACAFVYDVVLGRKEGGMLLSLRGETLRDTSRPTETEKMGTGMSLEFSQECVSDTECECDVLRLLQCACG